MSLNRRMSDCDKLIDPFCGNTSVLITGNAVELAHIRSLTCSHNNKLTQSYLFFPPLIFFNPLKRHYLMQCIAANIFCSCVFSKACYSVLKPIQFILKTCANCFDSLAFAVFCCVACVYFVASLPSVCLKQLATQPHLCLHIGQFPCLLCSLAQQVRSDFNHRSRVVVHSGLLDLDHVLLHAVLYVIL